MFHFPGCPSHGLLIHPWMTAHYHSRVPPFGYPGIKAYLQLPQAFRSLSRPSSAISALASTLRSYSLDLSILQIVCQFSTTTFLRLLRSDCRFLICVSFVSSAMRIRLRRNQFLSCAVFKVRASIKRSWWAEVDSNHRPLAYQASALTD